MIWIRMICGAVIAGLLGFTFRRSWRWEHGAGPRKLRRGDVGKWISVFPSPTQEFLFNCEMLWEQDAELRVLSEGKDVKKTGLFLPPTLLFGILLLFLVEYVYYLGPREGLVRFAALAEEVMLFLSVYYVLLLILLPLLRRWFSARACAVLWLVPAFLSWQGVSVFITTLPLPRQTLYIPRRTLPVIGAVWLAGFLTVGGYYLISHLRFRRRVRKHSEIEWDPAVRAIWTQEQEKLDYRRQVTLLRGDVPAPFSMGRKSEINTRFCRIGTTRPWNSP